MRSETVEVETGTHKTKVSDSGYSNSCSNSQSQRSSGSSKSRNSGSSRSSGYHGPSAHQQGETSSSSKEKESKRKTGSGGGGGTGAGTEAQNGSHQAQHKAQHQGNGQVGLSIPSPALPSHFTNGHQGGGGETGVENELLQAAAFTQTLTSLKRIKSIPQLNDLEKIGDTENRERGEENGVDGGKEEKMEVESAGDEDSWEMEELMKLVRGEKEPAKENELGLVVSMDDGMVIHTTKSIRKVLGFPKEMWLGRSFIDFIHPRHRASFANHITAILASNDTAVCRGRLYSCYLRRYRGLMSTGFTVTEKWVGYLPFQLAMSFKERQTASALDIYLVINAIPIKSAYDDESSNMQPQKFSTRHTASSYICHVDPEVTPYFGYLPQDIIGRSVFDFYHPEDLHFLKEVYEAVMKEQGHLFRSKPYRFRCQNGGFALIESELSSFINPWSRKLEFIICQHTVLRGPPDPDVITPVFEPESPQISEEVLKETKIVQEEIKCLLNETVVRNFETAKQQVSKRCKDLAAFMENLIDELTRPPNLKVDVHTEEHTFSGGGGETGVENELLQAAAFTQTLTSLKRIKSIPQLNDLEKIGDTENRERGEENGVDGGKEEKMEVESAGDEDSWEMEELMKLVRGEKEPAKENELGLVVSMDDGMVIHTTKSIRKVLGFPKEMWLGRSFIDFIHPRHRASFANHITAILASNDTAVCRGRLYSCYLRRYRGLMSTGFTVTEKWVGYLPFQLAMSFKERQTASALDIYLVINAIPIKSAYDDESSNMQPQKFSTRHTASSYICHVDPEVTPYFGYLPQDIIGRSVFDFYHPEDLHFLKEVYEAVMKEQGHLFRSKPYRFRCQNGGFALIESELSSFINPWSRKLEFIICQHTVLRGPPDPDVITPVFEPESPQISEEVLKETKIVQEEIKCLLNETVVRNFETAKQQVSKRCKDLAAFMENLIDELTRPPNLKVDVHTEEHTFSERDSVMLGEISPHHEYYDSGTSSETPPSYTQLNYNENIQRFFESKPKTTMSDESLEPKVTPQGGSGGGGSGGEEGKTSPALETSSNSKSDGSRRGDTRESGSGGESGGNSGGSGSRGTGETSSGGNSIEVSREERRGGRPPAATLPQPLPEVVQPPPGPSGEGTSQEPADQPPVYKPPTLTELLLSRHNEDMEKQMVAKHREARSRSDSKSKERLKGMEKMQGEETGGCHGMKRSGSHSWEGEPHKSIKAEHHPHEGQQYLGAGQEEPLTLNREGAGGQTDFEQLLPPLPPPPLPSQPQQSVSALLSMSSRPIPSMDMNGWNGGGAGGLGTGFTSPLMPFYYMPPSGQGLRRTDHLSLYPHPHSLPHPHPHPHQVGGMGYMGSMVYQPVVLSPQPVMYSPVTVLPPAGPQHPAGGATLEFCQPPLPIPSQAPGHLMVKPNNRLLAPHPHHLSNTNPKIGCSGGRRLMGGGRELGCLPETRGFEMEGQASRFQPPSRSSDLKTATNENSIPSDDTGSSFSSLLKTDESLRSSSEIDTKQETELRDRRKKDWEVNNIRKEAPWTENVNINPELVLKYQLQERSIDEVLTKDLSTLNHVTQPELVTKQLSQMYLDLEAEGAKHDLFDESSSTSSDSQLSPTASHHSAKVKEDDEDKIFMEYDKMVIVFEEEAPLPPPMAQSCT